MINKRQKKNRKRLAKITRLFCFIFSIYTLGLVGNMETEYKTSIIHIAIYIVISIITLVLFELCNYLKIEL